MTYEDARIREIAKEECRIRQWKKRLVGLAIIAGAVLFVLEMMVMAWMR